MIQNPETVLLPKPIHIRGVNVVSGRGRGKTIGIPTINVELSSVPDALRRGIYACRITLGSTIYDGALHYGPRLAFNDSETMEVHIIDEVITDVPATVDIDIVAYIRSVENFKSTEDLVSAIQSDIDISRGILLHA